jgi:chemotaxis protein MotB
MPQPLKSAARAAQSSLRAKRSEERLETAGMMRWLLTYADMITLMLALFIILFAMSTISAVKVQQFAKLVSAGFDNVWSVNQPPNGGANGAQSFESSSQIPAIEKELEKFVRENRLSQQVQVHMDHRGIVITLLSDKSFFDTGSARLRPATLGVLDGVSKFLKENNNLIRVEGNTDNVPIHTPQYPTNWELSTARAVNVVRYLVEHDGIAPTRISASGYGQFNPRVPNGSPAQRQENRRVDVILLNATITKAEKGR